MKKKRIRRRIKEKSLNTCQRLARQLFGTVADTFTGIFYTENYKELQVVRQPPV